MKKSLRPIFIILIVVLICVVFFTILQRTDNKYSIKQPIGEDGNIKIQEADLKRGSPIFLIDGWKLILNGKEKTTYIGEYSNYKQEGYSTTVSGEAVYRIVIDYSGEDIISTVTFPELISTYELFINQEKIGAGKGNASATFTLKEGKTELCVKIISGSGYLSGMYFPGAISTPETISRMITVKTLCYLSAFTVTITLALFTLVLWKDKQTAIYRMFGFFCLAFCLYISYYFVHLFHFPFENSWYLIEDIAFYMMLLSLMRLSLVCAKLHRRSHLNIVTLIGIAVPVISILLYLFIPILPIAADIHGMLQDIYRVLVFIGLTSVSIYAAIVKINEYHYLLSGNMVFGVGLLVNILSANKFEPVYTFWQFEWCGLILVLIFAAMMVRRNQRILKENRQLTENLEQLVQIRTKKLNTVLEERRQFFFHMAHNLKAPLAATGNYISMIKAHQVDIDSELSQYLSLVEAKQSEMKQRVESLNTLSQIDKIRSNPQKIIINEFIKEMYHNYKPEADVLGIYLKLNLEDSEAAVTAQKEKLVILIENLLSNAFSFTPMEGSITISTRFYTNTAAISVQDTGSGIDEGHLPHIFERFYVGRANQNEGSGLGLYMVKLIADEYGGTASVTSELGKGSAFTVTFPLC